MPRQSNGSYLAPGGTSAVSGKVISSTAFNTLETDIGTEIGNSVDRLGRGSMQAALNMGSNRIVSLSPGLALTDAATILQLSSAAQLTRASALTTAFPVGTTAISTNGYATAGDGGGGVFVQVATNPNQAGASFQDAGGLWWQFVPTGPICPEHCGAKGDGATDDTTALQNWLNLLFTNGSFSGELRTGKTYMHSAQLTLKDPTADGYSPPYTGSGSLFVKKRVISIKGNGAQLCATAYMLNQLELVFNASVSAEAPFDVEIDNVFFEANGQAVRNIFLNYAYEVRISHCRLHGSTYAAIEAEGYGGHHINDNTISAPICIHGFNGGFNDMTFRENDLYPTSMGILFDQFVIGSGNIVIEGNVFTTNGTSQSVIGVNINAEPYTPFPVTASSSGGNLATGNYYVYVTGLQTEDGTAAENATWGIYGPVAVTGPHGSLSITLAAVAGYLFNVYVDTAAFPEHLATIPGVTPTQPYSGAQYVMNLAAGTYTITAIGMAQTSPSPNPVNGHFVISDNEFYGQGGANFSNAIYGSGVPGLNNLLAIKADRNHFLGTSGTFCTVANATDVNITNNTMGGIGYYPAITGGGLANLSNVNDCSVTNNTVQNCTGVAVSLTLAYNTTVIGNRFRNVGDRASNNAVVAIYSGQNNLVMHNGITQTDSAHANYGVTEGATANINWAYDNMFVNVGTNYAVSGAQSYFQNQH